MSEVSFEPGCFGSALTFKLGSKVCGACIFAARCQPLSEERLTALHAKFALPEVPRTKTKAERELEDLLETLRPLDVSGQLKGGANPFEGTAFGYLKIICHLLLNRPAGLDVKAIAPALEMKLRWERKIALAHARQSVRALIALGAVIETDGKIVVNQE